MYFIIAVNIWIDIKIVILHHDGTPFVVLGHRRFLGTTQQVQTLKHKHKQEVKNVIVEEIRIRGATIRVHDDSYVNRTKEEIQSSIDACSRIIREALIRKEKTA